MEQKHQPGSPRTSFQETGQQVGLQQQVPVRTLQTNFGVPES